jgi:uncharacterized membrane protein
VPIPETFTHVEVQALDGRDQVVGFATRPAGHPQGNQRAFVHDLSRGSTVLLPLPNEFRGSCAFDISRDGTCVSGYVVGRAPPRMSPCVWTRRHEEWLLTLLPIVNAFNPLLTTAQVHVSDNGLLVAASAVDRITPEGVRHYGLYVWRKRDLDSWDSQRLTDHAVHLGDVNDAGMIAGRVLQGNRHHAFVFDPARGPLVLPLPDGRGSAYATDINAQGQVVGVLEDPPGPAGTVTAFLWERGQLQPLPFDIRTAASTANCITDDGRIGGLVVRTEAVEEQSQVESYILTLPTK